MIKYFCDRCGEELCDYNMNEIFRVTIDPPMFRSWMDDATTGTYILCYDCVREVNKCIERKAKKL